MIIQQYSLFKTNVMFLRGLSVPASLFCAFVIAARGIRPSENRDRYLTQKCS